MISTSENPAQDNEFVVVSVIFFDILMFLSPYFFYDSQVCAFPGLMETRRHEQTASTEVVRRTDELD